MKAKHSTMKRINLPVSRLFLVPWIFFFATHTGNGQENLKTRVYEIKYNIAVFPCDITGRKIIFNNDSMHTPPIGARFILIRPMTQNSDEYIIRYLVWNKKKSPILYNYYNKPWNQDSLQWTSDTRNNSSGWRERSSNEDLRGESYSKIDKFFLVQHFDLDSNCIKIYPTGFQSAVFTVGMVTMPVKLRLGNSFEFQGNLSLGSTAGVKMRISHVNPNFINLLFATSISTVTLDSFNTKGKLNAQPLNNMAAFSPSFGLVFEFGKAQAGLFYGWDILNKSTQVKYDWVYNKKPWISIGFGFSILNVDGKSEKQPTRQPVSDADIEK